MIIKFCVLTGYSQEEQGRCDQVRDKKTLSPNSSPVIVLDDNDSTVAVSGKSPQKKAQRVSKKRSSSVTYTEGPPGGSCDHSVPSTSDGGSMVKRAKVQSSEKESAQWERIEKKKQKALVCTYNNAPTCSIVQWHEACTMY